MVPLKHKSLRSESCSASVVEPSSTKQMHQSRAPESDDMSRSSRAQLGRSLKAGMISTVEGIRAVSSHMDASPACLNRGVACDRWLAQTIRSVDTDHEQERHLDRV